ncbi:MAG: Crp/Fnr family transcriptional regulator [Flavobacteriales bacterium]|nr:Crp/Fnr family transcriptional regulator [Flavobacteriales bacterium]HRN37315.1 Crp/Fnr family transcriptional regulator [Flavobacteriales bacterium]HRO39110.1 Crp/Fnr family transcriptional regulator [Flavobacteriales bacterium]HRP81530.1 Crp/Fnr family transcriptional regulator [Flavobacteriales bacterium]
MFTDQALKRAYDGVVVRKDVPAGTVLMQVGDPITQIPIVKQGSLRILAQDGEGRERYLYHILPGESCATSLTCCVAKRVSNVRAVVEEDAELLMIPVRYVDEWMVYPEWRKFVNEVQAQRYEELLEAFEVVAFHKLDEQLWNYLLKRAQASGERVLQLTHQQIADELGSPREVITRLLQQLRADGRVTLGRGEVEVHTVPIAG